MRFPQTLVCICFAILCLGIPTSAPCEWVHIQTKPPSARANFGMATFSQTGQVVLYGGTDGTASQTDNDCTTWIWNGTKWLKTVSPSFSPRPRNGPAMA